MTERNDLQIVNIRLKKMFLVSNIWKNEYILLILVLTSYVQSNQRSSPKFVDVSGLTSSLVKATGSISKDLNNIYTGWVDTVLYPVYLKGSTYVNTLYGQVNRTGLVLAGAALLGVSGVVFLGEVNALPSLESMAKGLRDVEGIMNNMFKGSFQFIPFKGTSIDSFDRADVVHDMPGPPYNYDIETVMNLTRKSFESNKNRKNGISGGDFTTIDKYFEELNKGSETEQVNAWKSEEKKKTKKRKQMFKLKGQNEFNIKKPELFKLSKNKKVHNFFHKPNVFTNQYSPIRYREKYPRKSVPTFQTNPFRRKPIRRPIQATASPFQSDLQNVSGNQKTQEWKGLLGLVGL